MGPAPIAFAGFWRICAAARGPLPPSRFGDRRFISLQRERRRRQGELVMLKEFREFALKGNMVDLAIGVIIGAAVGGLVNSIVNDLFMPIVGLITGGFDFSNVYWQLAGAPQTTLEAARNAGATIAYGHFITLLINFLLIAWVLFMVVKGVNRLKRTEPTAPATPAPPPRQEMLLEQIRDLLAKK
jgi:large conductance mechanosensitive channel